ncbi:hypothetical protein ACFX19_017198 [Malus domestica]
MVGMKRRLQVPFWYPLIVLQAELVRSTNLESRFGVALAHMKIELAKVRSTLFRFTRRSIEKIDLASTEVQSLYVNELLFPNEFMYHD